MHRDSKFNIITEGQKIGIKLTCEKYHISRTIYYRWLKRYKTSGIKGLDNIEKNFIPPNKTKSETTNTVINLIKAHPHYGPRSIKYLLDEVGENISESAVYNIMKRNNLSTKAQRIRFASKKEKRQAISYPSFNQLGSGECWLFWATYYGHFENYGPIYEYTIFDYKSKIACSRLYNALSVSFFEDLLMAAAIPVAQTLNFNTKHLCLFDDSDYIHKHAETFLTNTTVIFQDSGYDITVHLLKNGDDLNQLQELKKIYTHNCLSFLMPYIQKGISFNTLKIQFQKHIREYNLSYKSPYDAAFYSPVEYHVKETHSDPILPLWAYVDRSY